MLKILNTAARTVASNVSAATPRLTQATPGAAAQQRRTWVNDATLSALGRGPLAKPIGENFRFQRYAMCVRQANDLHRDLLQGATGKPVTAEQLEEQIAPTAKQIFDQVQKGPVVLQQQKLLEWEQAGHYSGHHAVVAVAAFEHKGRLVGVMVDGNDQQFNPVMDAIEEKFHERRDIAQRSDRPSTGAPEAPAPTWAGHLTRDELNELRRALEIEGGPQFDQVMYRLVDLDRMVDLSKAKLAAANTYHSEVLQIAALPPANPNKMVFAPGHLIQTALPASAVQAIGRAIDAADSAGELPLVDSLDWAQVDERKGIDEDILREVAPRSDHMPLYLAPLFVSERALIESHQAMAGHLAGLSEQINAAGRDDGAVQSLQPAGERLSTTDIEAALLSHGPLLLQLRFIIDPAKREVAAALTEPLVCEKSVLLTGVVHAEGRALAQVVDADGLSEDPLQATLQAHKNEKPMRLVELDGLLAPSARGTRFPFQIDNVVHARGTGVSAVMAPATQNTLVAAVQRDANTRWVPDQGESIVRQAQAWIDVSGDAAIASLEAAAKAASPP